MKITTLVFVINIASISMLKQVMPFTFCKDINGCECAHYGGKEWHSSTCHFGEYCLTNDGQTIDMLKDLSGACVPIFLWFKCPNKTCKCGVNDRVEKQNFCKSWWTSNVLRLYDSEIQKSIKDNEKYTDNITFEDFYKSHTSANTAKPEPQYIVKGLPFGEATISAMENLETKWKDKLIVKDSDQLQRGRGIAEDETYISV